MIKVIILTINLFLISACSFNPPPNQWQYTSANAFDSYTKNFLSSNDDIAKNDLDRAIKYAKNSADLTTLARIYLGKCALNISVGLEDSCKDYKNIAEIINDNKLDAYYNFIRLNLNHLNKSYLNKSYQKFAIHLNKKEFYKANIEILKISKPTSKLLCAALIKSNLNSNTRKEMIKVASFYGYKRSVLFWLKESKKYTTDINRLNYLSKKISILESND